MPARNSPRRSLGRECIFTSSAGVELPTTETHTLDAPLRLKPHVTLQGKDGGVAALTTTGPDVNFIELDPGEDEAAHTITIRQLHLKGPGTSEDVTQDVSNDSLVGCGILASTVGDGKEVHRVTIEACVIENVSGCGIRFDTRHDVLVRDVTIRDCMLRQNRRPADPNKANSYKDIFFNGTRFQDIHLENNICTFTPTNASTFGNDSGIGFVINQVKRPGCFVRDTKILGNTCSGHRRHGIITNYSSLVPSNVDVRDNTCQDNRL